MKARGKKLVTLFLIFSLMMLSANLYAKERRGTTLIIQRKGDQIKNTRLKDTPWETSVMAGIRGELIAVKPNSLLLLSITGRDMSVDIADIRVIRVVKKSKALLGSGIGLIIFGGGTALFVETFGRNSWEPPDLHKFAVGFGAIGAIVGLLIGGITGELLGKDKTIQIEGMTDAEIQEALDKLRKKARIRDYK